MNEKGLLRFGAEEPVSSRFGGSRPLPGTLYWNTMNAGDYSDHGAGGVGVFRQDSNWSTYKVAASFAAETATPEPGSLGLLAGGLIFVGITVRVRVRRSDH